MSYKSECAADCFNDGFNCAQAVFSTFCEDLGLDKTNALKASTSFGAGMGYIEQTCGAVTGAFLVLGLKYGQTEPEDKHLKALTYLKVKDFAHRFRKLNGSINCTELLGINLGDEAKLLAARQLSLIHI